MLHDDVVGQLRRIGEQLTRQVEVEVCRDGVVRPSETGAFTQPMGRGDINGSERTRRSAAGSWKGAAGRKGTAGGSGKARPASPDVVGSSPRPPYDRQLTEVCDEYTGSQYWLQDRGLWLLVPSTILRGLDRRALFLVAIPYDFDIATVAAWGFWDRNDGGEARWIGPRHTNYPTGSICAFHLGDESPWRNGGSLVTLLDLYSEWALRHLYLEQFHRWPGSQISSSTYERMVETHPEELCGCGSTDKMYSECHQPADLACNRVAIAMSFMKRTNGGRRDPPIELFDVLSGKREPPPVVGFVMRPIRSDLAIGPRSR